MCAGEKHCKKCIDKTKLTYDNLGTLNSSKTEEGFLVAKVILARTGIQQYLAKEIGHPKMNDEVILVNRSGEEVFNEDSMKSFIGKPVTNDHPPEFLSLSNVKKYQVGHLTKEPWREQDNLVSELIITDEKTIMDIEQGKKQVSNGYSCVYDFGQETAEQKEIRGNHVAIVDKGRCGSECRILDNLGETLMSDETKYMDEIKALKEQLAQRDEDLKKSNELMQAQKDQLASYKADKDKENSDEAKKKDKEANDTMIKNMVEIIDSAKSIMPNYDYHGKNILEIKKDIIKHRKPNAKLTMDSSEYINAWYDSVVDDIATTGSKQASVFVADSISKSTDYSSDKRTLSEIFGDNK